METVGQVGDLVNKYTPHLYNVRVWWEFLLHLVTERQILVLSIRFNGQDLTNFKNHLRYQNKNFKHFSIICTCKITNYNLSTS